MKNKPTVIEKEKWENRPRRFGKSTLVTNSFLALAEAGEGVEYHHPNYVCLSRKRYEELTQNKPTVIEKDTKCKTKNCKGNGSTNGLCVKHYMIFWNENIRPNLKKEKPKFWKTI